MKKNLTSQVNDILARNNKKIRSTVKSTMSKNKDSYKNIYKNDVKSSLKIKSNYLSTITARLFDKDKERLPQLNIYSKKYYIIESHYNKLVSEGQQLIYFDYVKKSYTKKKRTEMLNLFFVNNLIIKKDNVLYVKYTKDSKRYINAFLRNSYKKFTNDKKEISKNVRDYVKYKTTDDNELLVPLCFLTEQTKRKRRINLNNINEKIVKQFNQDLRNELNNINKG